MNETSLTLSSPHQVLNFIPELVGFKPVDSLVLLWMKHKKVVLTTRVDVCAALRTSYLETLMETCVKRTSADKCFIAVFYSDTQVAYDVALRASQCCPVTVFDAVLTDGHNWSHLRPFEDRLCMDAAQPLHPSSYLETATATEAVSQAADAAVARMLEDKDSKQRVAAMQKLLAQVQDSTETSELGSQTALDLAALLFDGPARDVVWTAISEKTALQMQQLWTQVVKRCPPALAVGPICVVGICAWQLGNQSLLQVCAEQAEQLKPDWSPSVLLREIIQFEVPHQVWAKLQRQAA